MFGLGFEMSLVLVLCLLAACIFEIINGFHDTANAVATVIYTKTLKPTYAVIWSGLWNFLGVFIGGIAVAMGILNLLPAQALVDQNVYHSIAMILALIITAIIWNIGTWYLGIPCSSSHTLLGSIFGVGIAYMLLPDVGAVALNWVKVKDAGLSLLVSPVIGFGFTLGIMALAKKYAKKNKVLFEHDSKRKHPPLGIRALLVLTCTSVSFTHGSNDGQKGVGLIMIILIAIIPAKFAIDTHKAPAELLNKIYVIENSIKSANSKKMSDESRNNCEFILSKTDHIKIILSGVNSFDSLKGKENFELRKDINAISKRSKELLTVNMDQSELPIDKEKTSQLKKSVAYINGYVEYAPLWVIMMISLSLGIGTMVGWKRIVVTVGEKIGKTPLTYAQGASAELVAASTIALSTSFGLPVSTTHVLSSGVAGSMVAQNGLKNLRKKTIRNILTAWLITLPVTVLVSGSIFLLLRWLMS
jgi:phosphate/sulfate permease